MVDDLDYLHIERCLVRVRGELLLKHKSFNFLIQSTDIDIYITKGIPVDRECLLIIIQRISIIR